MPVSVAGVADALEALSLSSGSGSTEFSRGHVVLILDHYTQSVAWEAAPTLSKHSVSRMPSLGVMLHCLRRSGGYDLHVLLPLVGIVLRCARLSF